MNRCTCETDPEVTCIVHPTYVAELEAKVERLENALAYVAYYGLDDCAMASIDMRAVAKAALLEGKQG